MLRHLHFNGLVQDCGIPIANALEILQYCTKPPICSYWMYFKTDSRKSTACAVNLRNTFIYLIYGPSFFLLFLTLKTVRSPIFPYYRCIASSANFMSVPRQNLVLERRLHGVLLRSWHRQTKCECTDMTQRKWSINIFTKNIFRIYLYIDRRHPRSSSPMLP